jgi:hypothetical protein
MRKILVVVSFALALVALGSAVAPAIAATDACEAGCACVATPSGGTAGCLSVNGEGDGPGGADASACGNAAPPSGCICVGTTCQGTDCATPCT